MKLVFDSGKEMEVAEEDLERICHAATIHFSILKEREGKLPSNEVRFQKLAIDIEIAISLERTKREVE